MKHILILTTVALGCVSCNSGPQPQSAPDVQPQQAPNNTPRQAPAPTPRPSDSGASIPKGAQFTIYCGRVEGELHVERANRMKQELIQSTGMRDWYAIHEDSQSILYYGYYQDIQEKRAQQDRQKIDLMADAMGNRPFKQAMLMSLTAPDPVAPPAWNLANAPGAYTLQIGAYKDSPDRKAAAVDAVKAARAQNVEAYYYHGNSISLVCVGHWPDTAVRFTGMKRSRTRDGTIDDSPGALPLNVQAPTDSSGGADAGTMVVPPNVNDDPQMRKNLDDMQKSTGVKVVKPTIEIIDPSLRAAMAMFPYNTVNGEQLKRVVNGKETYDPSLLVPIPHDPQTANNGLAPNSAGPAPIIDPAFRPVPTPRQPAQGGRLRSIDG